MARKNYTDEFRRQAVDLYRSTPGATLRGIAADLGISRHTLHEWVRAQTATAGTADATAGGASHPGRTGGPGHRRGRLSPEDELAALRARVATLQTENDELVAEQAKLVTEREILRRAAKYFARETNW